MILLDTHAWIWWADECDELSPAASQAIAAADVIAVSAISVWEIAILVRKGRLGLDRGVETWVGQALSVARVQEVPLSAHVALQSELLPGLHGDPADRFIAATAIHYGCSLVTKDELLHDYPALRCVW